MTALQTPAPDAPASEWGALAVSIPGWPTKYRQPSGQLVDDHGIDWIYSDSIDWFNGGSGYPVPNPDHDGTAGCLLALLGPYVSHMECRVRPSGEVVWRQRADAGRLVVTGWLPLGRAAIAYAAAIGRWPGGGE